VSSQSNAPAEQPHPLKLTLLERFQLALVSWLVPVILTVIGCTLRVTYSFEEGAIQSIDDRELHPGIFPFWHRCVLPSTWIFRKRNLAVLTSRSLDGEYIARVIRRFGFVPVRGSSSRGGQRGLLEMRDLIANRQGVAFTIDGPRGPRYVAKKGPVSLARMTGVPITPFYVALDRAVVLNTWDGLMIPKPFSRALIRVGKKIFVPSDADDSAIEHYFAEMQASLERVTEFAQAQFSSPRD
jgi:lysophospholipid acyltransferase (LPLAT)-like uncharacterized protein